MKTWFQKHICDDFPHQDRCFDCNEGSCRGCGVKEIYIWGQGNKFQALYSTDPCEVSATVERAFLVGQDVTTGDPVRIEINSERIKEMLEGFIDRYLEIRRGDGADPV
jgi:hypothetical protein